MYQKRKDYQLQKLERVCEVLSAKARFIELVVRKELIIKRRKLIDLIADLKRRGFVPFNSLKGKADASEIGDNADDQDDAKDEEAEEEPDEEESEVANQKRLIKEGVREFDYLVGMPISSLTHERYEELRRQRDQKQKEHTALKKLEPANIWLDELVELELALDRRDEARREAERKSAEKVEKARSKKASAEKRGRKRAQSEDQAEAATKSKRSAAAKK
jgi:DNA topoisomerase-2